MVTVKYAPKDAPSLGKGRWTWPLYSLKDERLIKLIINRGIELQSDLDDWTSLLTDWDILNPQCLWKAFKDDIRKIAKKHIRESYHRITTCINNLEKNRKTLTESPDLDNNNAIRWNEAILANEITHLENLQARQKCDTLKAQLINHGEKLGGIWSAMSKENRPRDLIRCLKTPNSNPPQYERDSCRMAELARDYFDNLQQKDLTSFNDNLEYSWRLNSILDEILA